MNNTNNSSFRVETHNVYAKGAHTLPVFIGNSTHTVNFTIDTGSSTLVLNSEKQLSVPSDSSNDTSLVQCVVYGMGGWCGQVIRTQIAFKNQLGKNPTFNTDLSITKKVECGCFGNADGILGLAFHSLNKAHDISAFIEDPANNTDSVEQALQGERLGKNVKEIESQIINYPEIDILPTFTAMEETHLAKNVFSFTCYRSSIHYANAEATIADLKADPLNKGCFEIGESKPIKTNLSSKYRSIDIVSDTYYNLNLVSVTVHGFPPMSVPKLSTKEKLKHHSNAILDTGATLIVLENSVYEYVISCLKQAKPGHNKLLIPFKEIDESASIDSKLLAYEQWPTIYFGFQSSDSKQPVIWPCPPNNYWQINAPVVNGATFKLARQLVGWPNQNIFGLPLMSNHQVVFDRRNGLGKIKFHSTSRFSE